MGGLDRRFDILRAAVRDNRSARRFWSRQPENAFTTRGYEIIPDFLPRDECRRLVQLADGIPKDRSRRLGGNCHVWVKSDASHGRNSQVQEILNVNDIDVSVDRLMRSGVIQDLYAERLAEAVEMPGMSLQIDGIDARTKRDFHVDTLYPPLFKAFIYLTDVEEDGDGPYTIVPRSHRHFGRKLLNDLVNAATTAARRDMHHFGTGSAEKILAPAGTLILSTQDAVHKGWTEQSRRWRYALIGHCTTATRGGTGPLRDGADFLDEPGHAAESA